MDVLAKLMDYMPSKLNTLKANITVYTELNLFQQQKQHVNRMTLHINAVMYTE